jgi:hypothetical protein
MLDFLDATLSRCDYVTDSRASVLYLPEGKVNCSNCLLEWRVVLSALDVWIWCHPRTSRYGAVRCTKVAPCHLRTLNTRLFCFILKNHLWSPWDRPRSSKSLLKTAYISLVLQCQRICTRVYAPDTVTLCTNAAHLRSNASVAIEIDWLYLSMYGR